ncbi:MAG: ferritin-like domain-containing protein [Micromonosporaceae bacterium]
MDRRTALSRLAGGAVVAGLGLTGCDLLSPEPPPPHPLMKMLDDTRAMLRRYDSALAAQPRLAERLTPLRDNHRTHIDELRQLIGPSASATPSAASVPSSPAPAAEKATLAALRTAEREGQAYATQACLSGKPAYAGLLGSIAACRATHAEVLK